MTQSSNRDIVFLSAVRTPFGTFGGSLKDYTAVDLTVVAAKAALERAKVAPSEIQHSIFGNVLQTTFDTIYFARHVALKAGCPIETPALTVNRLCGSGFQAIVNGAQEILLGDAEVCLVGGGESMSQAPHVVRGLRWGTPLGKSPQLEDSLWESLKDPVAGLSMAETAENLAVQYNLERSCVDEFAHRSQMLAKQAWDSGVFADEVVSVSVKDKKGQVTQFSRDEHMRPDTTMEGLSRLKPYFRTDGLVTAGNASGIGDGAAALVIAGADAVKDKGLKPLGRIVSWATVGVDPALMGMGPAPAIRKALATAGLKLADLDLIEINEAFAPQYLACEKELGLDRDKVNVNGGAIALGHPLGASGARLLLTLLLELRRRGKKYGVASACIGGGQGIAMIIEAL
jgi:acetyl-CoA acyltransferase 2